MVPRGSVAPKERVNIVYRPATGDAETELELPLKLLVIGDYTLREESCPLEEIKTINIDKDNFNDALRGQNLSLSLTVPDKLAQGVDEQAQLNAHLRFTSLQDFEPDAIVEQVPELRSLIALRDALKALKGPLGNIPDFRKKMQSLISDDVVRDHLLFELGIEKK